MSVSEPIEARGEVEDARREPKKDDEGVARYRSPEAATPTARRDRRERGRRRGGGGPRRRGGAGRGPRDEPSDEGARRATDRPVGARGSEEQLNAYVIINAMQGNFAMRRAQAQTRRAQARGHQPSP